MAEIVVSTVITVLCEKLIAGDLMKLAQSEGLDSKLKKWKKTLPLIQAVLADAGEKQITKSAVRLWVNNLQDLAYDIDDVLDELTAEVLRRKLNQESYASTSTSNLFKFVPTCCTAFTPRNIVYGQYMSSKVDDITTKLNDIVEMKNGLGLNVYVNVESSNRTEKRWEKTSVADESEVMGRDGDKEALLGKLLGSDEKMSIVSIVGMGGIGKTTLAKALYNDDKVKDHFELRSWVCVSEEFNVFNISKAIFQKVNGKNEDFVDLNLLHEALKEKLQKIRFLVVLDDVWNEEESEWELLKSALVGAPGSKIMVTTRNSGVASVMDSDEVYHLDVLSNEDALSLFAQHALGEKSFDKYPSLKLHGEGIMKKCGRLPLALKTLGRVLKGNRNGDKWEKLLKSEIWDIQDGKASLPALRLSYYHLPTHLKQPFAYCSSYPKDYVFDKKELVLLWMAQGFLSQSQSNNTSMESLGHEYFEELQSRSFFQQSPNDKLGYMMHDLVNDLATSVAGEFFFRLDAEIDVSGRNETFENFRHFSLIGQQCGSYTKLKELQRATRLRALLLVPYGWACDDLLGNILAELLPELKFLRVLSITRKITKVPQSIGSLKHLRYLNFSYTEITCLPEQVSHLYNLQSLLLRGCYKLSSLPGSFVKLINLRHLDISATPVLKKMPLGIGGLTSLQTLTKVIIEGPNGFKISELKGLSDLQGRLSIMELNKVINPVQAKDANLHQRKGIDVLEMVWSDVFDDSRDEMIEYEVLEGLRPHHNLENLKILFYKGPRFPSWIGDPSFYRLKELKLCDCRSTHLPTLGQLPSLEKLFVERMDEVKTIGFELLAPVNSFLSIAFPSLEVLKFDLMQGWEKWSTNGGQDNGTGRWFPRLREISITRCGRLVEVSIGLIPSLRVLEIEECSEAVLRSMVSVSSSLVALSLSNVEGLTQLHREILMQLQSVENLNIEYCDGLRYLWPEQEWKTCKIFPSLQTLEICHCTQLVSLGEKKIINMGSIMESIKEVMIVRNFTMESYTCPRSVERLRLFFCGSMTSLAFSTWQEHPASVTELIIRDGDNIKPTPEKAFGFLHVFCLRYLQIDNCKNLKSFPHEHLQSLTSLEEMFIRDCPSLDYSFPCGLWPPNLSILSIGRLNKPMSEWGHQNFPTSLVKLSLYGQNSGVVSFAVAQYVRNTTASSSFLLPPSLVSLHLEGFMDVESLSEVLQQLPCLKHLDTSSCPKLKDLPETTSAPSLMVIYRIKLPGPAILGEGKPENENHAIIFTRGEGLQTIDMNQDNYMEEAFKMRNLLQEFLVTHGLRTPTILGLREHIFTGSVSSLAWFMSNQETSFVTIRQRLWSNPLKVRFHYGHPDVFDRLFHLTRGGVSKASKIVNLSEDLFAGFNSTLRGGNVTHHEYIQVGKGRDVGLNQISFFEANIANGNGEQPMSR